jgi:hypothetical protein
MRGLLLGILRGLLLGGLHGKGTSDQAWMRSLQHNIITSFGSAYFFDASAFLAGSLLGEAAFFGADLFGADFLGAVAFLATVAFEAEFLDGI